MKYPTGSHSNNTTLNAVSAASPSWRSLLTAWLALIAFALMAPAALSQTRSAAPRAVLPFPAFELPDRAQGEQALSRISNRLPDVAGWYGMTVPQFTKLMREDRTAWLDRRGRVFFQEEIQLPLQGVTSPLTTDPLSPSLEPYDQTFRLHSRPAAKRTIYLNFVGATLTSTAWNSSSQPTITALPFDLDGVPYSFSNAELERIQYIWKRVAEDYSPFDVDVTTEPPPADRLTRSSSGDDTFGTTVLITKRTFYSCSCGGVAYLSVFDDVGDFYKPALVFYDALGGGSEKYVADAISHEAGHNMGLGHDGTSTSGYYTGHGSGATGWAPIMGVGYYQQLVQWSKGEYAGANNTQDDYVIMQNTGLPLRADDHGNSAAAATPMASTTASGVTTFSGSGVIDRQGDVDFLSFTAGVGSVTVNVSPAPRGPKLDVLATLRNSAGTVLATSNPTESLPAVLTANITTPGTYYVNVDGVGKGDPLATGYTDYGSVGQYLLSVTTQATASQPPTAVLAATPISGTAPLTVNFSADGSSDSDGTIVSYAWSFGDGGNQTGGTTAQRAYSTAGTYIASLTVTDNSGLTDTKSVTITVQQQATTYALTVGKSGAGSGTVSSSPAGISCGADCTENYASATSVTLTAAPASGSTFAGWSGACSGTGSCTVAMTAARSVTATFATTSYSLTVSKGGMGTGTVTSAPSGVDCGADCAENYAHGTSVTLTAAAASGSTFAGWSGACSGTGACTVSMTEARAVTATFNAVTYALTVAKSGTGSGTVTSSPTGVSCGSDCTENYAYGTSVTLTAAAASGSTFAGWTGACSGTGTCTVSMTAARSVTATFSAVSYSLTVGKSGTGSGTVTSSPTGVSCGADCTENYTYGTSVTLTAAAASGSTFAGWSGACSGTGACTVSMTEARAVTATFNAVTYALTVAKSGTGSGTVTSSPTGVSCGSDCTENYAYGSSVTLTAAAASGSTFAGWTGACSGTGTCTVSMTSASSVTASFDVLRTTSIGNIAMSLRASGGRTDALASVTVRDGSGSLVSGATVSGTWSGAVRGSASVVTGSSGQANFRSTRISTVTGRTFTFTVTGIALSGHTYNAAANAETSDSITIGGAQTPTAVLTADRTSGGAPLTVNFSAAGSSDADGTIASYVWTFSDSGSQTGATTQRIYSVPGTYTATLTVTDNSGLTDSKSITITVGTPSTSTTISVTDIAMSLNTVWGRTEGVALVTIRDSSGNVMPGATVSGTWSGVVSGGASLTANSLGQARFGSSRINATAGSVFTFTVTGVALSGFTYDSTRNVETSDSITR